MLLELVEIMLRKTGYALAGMLMVIGSAAMATDATVKSMTGSVLADTGNGFQDASVGMELNQGDRVMANEGAKAVIRYDTGCEETIVGEQMVKITEACKALVLAGGAGAGALVGANAVAVGTIGGSLGLGLIGTDSGSGYIRPVSP